MKKRTLIGLSVMVAFIATLVTGTIVMSDPGGGATIIQDQLCVLTWSGGFATTTDTQSVITPSGNTALICHFDIPDVVLDKAERDAGFFCSTNLGLTTDSMYVVSPSGKSDRSHVVL